MLRRTTQHAQALVEFAIASTLILLLLAAAVDLGLVFMNLQGITNAAQEGAQYGSRFLKVDDKGVTQLDLDEIRQRVRAESGATGGFGFVNMLDLNSDGIPDAIVTDANKDGTPDAQDTDGDGRFDLFQYGVDSDGDGQLNGVTGLLAGGSEPGGYRPLIDLNISDEYPDLFQYGVDTTGDGRFDQVTGLIPAGSQPAGYTLVTENYIKVHAVQDANRDGDPTNDANALADDIDSVDTTPCNNLADPSISCYVRVVVLSDHQTVFPLLDPVWDDKVPLRSQFVMPLRAGFTQAGAPTVTPVQVTNTPTVATATLTPSNTPTASTTPTNTQVTDEGPTLTPSNTSTPRPTNTRRPTSTPCPECTPTPTRTPRPPTNTPRPVTNTPTNTPRPATNTPTRTPVPNTPTPRPTQTGS